MLLKNDTQIYRILKSQADKSLIIDCIKRAMPKWVSTSTLSEFEECTEMLMYETTNYPYTRQLSVDEQRIAQERFTLIAGILPFIGDEQKRSQMICFLADQCSKQTLRRYICLYLVYQDVHCLAPQPKREKSLSPDEQNMQWGLNKFYYTRQKQTLTAAYTMMLKAKYTDKDGKLLPEYPSFTQFRYCFRKTRDKKKECIMPPVWLLCGINDILYQNNEKMYDTLSRIGVPVKLIRVSGGHNWLTWNLYLNEMMEWLINLP